MTGAPVFNTAESLDDYLQSRNERGLDADVALIDARSVLWLTYGEERSGGGEWMTCWLLGGDPQDRDGRRCDNCGGMVDSLPLTAATYPVRLIHDGVTTR